MSEAERSLEPRLHSIAETSVSNKTKCIHVNSWQTTYSWLILKRSLKDFRNTLPVFPVVESSPGRHRQSFWLFLLALGQESKKRVEFWCQSLCPCLPVFTAEEHTATMLQEAFWVCPWSYLFWEARTKLATFMNYPRSKDKNSKRDQNKAGCRGSNSKLRPTLSPEGHQELAKKYWKNRAE